MATGCMSERHYLTPEEEIPLVNRIRESILKTPENWALGLFKGQNTPTSHPSWRNETANVGVSCLIRREYRLIFQLNPFGMLCDLRSSQVAFHRSFLFGMFKIPVRQKNGEILYHDFHNLRHRIISPRIEDAIKSIDQSMPKPVVIPSLVKDERPLQLVA